MLKVERDETKEKVPDLPKPRRPVRIPAVQRVVDNMILGIINSDGIEEISQA